MLKKFIFPVLFVAISLFLFINCLEFTVDNPSELLNYVRKSNDVEIGYYEDGSLILDVKDSDLNRLLYEFGFHEFYYSICNHPVNSEQFFLISCDKGDIKLIPTKYTVILEYDNKQWWLNDGCLLDELKLLVPDLFVSDIDVLSHEAATSLAICDYYDLDSNDSDYYWWAMACFLSRAYECTDDVGLEYNYLYLSEQSAFELSMFLFSNIQAIPDVPEIYDYNGNLLVERTSEGYIIRFQATEGCKMEWKYHACGELFVQNESVAVYDFLNYSDLFCSGFNRHS